MTRQEFLKSLWVRIFKPVMIIGVLAFLVRFFLQALDSESEEREFINLISFGLVIGGLFISVVFLLKYVSMLIVANTPDKVTNFLTRNAKRIKIALYVIAGGVLLNLIVKLIIEREYWSLVGMLAVVIWTFLSRVFMNKKDD